LKIIKKYPQTPLTAVLPTNQDNASTSLVDLENQLFEHLSAFDNLDLQLRQSLTIKFHSSWDRGRRRKVVVVWN